MEGYLADDISIVGFKECWDDYNDDQIDEYLSHLLPIYLRSCKWSSKAKTNFLEEFFETIEKYLQALEVQIQFHYFHCQNQTLEKYFCQNEKW